MDEETPRTGELVTLVGQSADCEFLDGEFGPGELEALCGVGLVDVDGGGLRFVAPGLELLEGVLTHLVGLVAARGVVVGRAAVSPPRSCPVAAGGISVVRQHNAGGRPFVPDRESDP